MNKILFGAGKVGKFIVKNRLIEGIAYFCDNNIQEECVLGIEVIRFDKLVVIHKNYEVILTVKDEYARNAIINQLRENDIQYIDYFKIDKIKYALEYDYWKKVFQEENGHFNNKHYKDLMLAIVGEKDDSFLSEKVVADFGCGPRGSLVWMDSPSMKIGIDVLMQYYLQEFGQDMMNHNMVYVTSTEKYIPLPDKSVDCLVTINSLDHVRNLNLISAELIRILKKGGMLIASFNLNEPINECEPQNLNEEILREVLLQYFDIKTYKLAKKDSNDTYRNILDAKYVDKVDDEDAYILWVYGYKR